MAVSNDIREMEDQNPIPEEDGGDLYLVNGSMTKLADAGALQERQEVICHRFKRFMLNWS